MGFRQLGRIAATAALLCVSAVSAQAFTVDGRLSDDDNYSAVYDLDFFVSTDCGPSYNSQTVSGGKLHIGRDGSDGDVYLLVEIPTSIVDNVYGDAADDSGSGWDDGHSFYDLKRSDGFSFSVNTKYGWKWLDVDYADWEGEPEIDSDGGHSTLKDVATSLEYNLSQGYGDTSNSPDPINGSPPSDWIQAVQYEFKLKGSKFEDGEMIGLADLSWPYLHASPNKLNGSGEIFVKCLHFNTCDEASGPPIALPAPGGGVMFALAVGFLGYMRRRRRS